MMHSSAAGKPACPARHAAALLRLCGALCPPRPSNDPAILRFYVMIGPVENSGRLQIVCFSPFCIDLTVCQIRPWGFHLGTTAPRTAILPIRPNSTGTKEFHAWPQCAYPGTRWAKPSGRRRRPFRASPFNPYRARETGRRRRPSMPGGPATPWGYPIGNRSRIQNLLNRRRRGTGAPFPPRGS